MKHVTYGEKSLFMGDDAADVLLEYARLVADTGRADTVTLRSISPDGNTVEASFLLNVSTVLMTESTHSNVEPPDNSASVEDIRERIAAIERPAAMPAEEAWDRPDYDVTATL